MVDAVLSCSIAIRRQITCDLAPDNRTITGDSLFWRVPLTAPKNIWSTNYPDRKGRFHGIKLPPPRTKQLARNKSTSRDYGIKQPKWIESIEVTDHWEPGFWVDRGWDKDARNEATSVVDTVAVDMTIINADHPRLVRTKKQKPAACFAGRQHGSCVAYSGATPILRKTHE